MVNQTVMKEGPQEGEKMTVGDQVEGRRMMMGDDQRDESAVTVGLRTVYSKREGEEARMP